MYSLNEKTPPATEPVDLQEMKDHLRVDTTDDDLMIGQLIKSAREYAEIATGRSFINTTWEYKTDEYPTKEGGKIRLPKSPLSSVTSIVYTDTNGATQIEATSVYDVNTDHIVGYVVPAYNQSWSDARNKTNSIVVEFVAGYGASADVPEGARQAIKMLVSHWYEHRMAVSELNYKSVAICR